MTQEGVTGGTLYLVALPIGHRRDITYRAVDILRAVDLIAAEDTRDFRATAREWEIATPVISYHDHNEHSRAPELIERLLGGASVALVSDAGTPLVNDPGFRIVGAAIDAGIEVTSIPGASAVTTALAAAGLPVAPFVYLGFPPRTGGKRRSFFAPWLRTPATLVFFEAPHRLIACLEDVLTAGGDRPACLARNLTKPHERYQRGMISDLIAQLRAEGEVRGEVTVLVAGSSEEATEEPEDAAPIVAEMLAEGFDSRSILEQLTSEHGMKRRAAYDLILRVRSEGSTDE
ncbi:MAG: 16S rRNA (cytidine(1402)-2'-O)-methyltransferase [Thermomicrobiales bacterium]|nr:16S rRNA (cytidine(1402)-2'-O)-methyltransferase [Thermomicrobiales bacterium]